MTDHKTRRVAFPLPPVHFDTVAADLPLDGSRYTFPPVPVNDRIQRFRLFDDLLRGDWRKLTNEQFVVASNIFQVAFQQVVDSIGAVPPEVNPAELTDSVSEIRDQAAFRYLLDGGANIFTDPDGFLAVLPMKDLIPTETGWFYCRDLPSTENGIPDGKHIVGMREVFDGVGVYFEETRELVGAQLGNILGDPVYIPGTPDRRRIAANKPDLGGVGPSLTEIIVSHVLERSRRFSGASLYLDKQVNPSIVARGNPDNKPVTTPSEIVDGVPQDTVEDTDLWDDTLPNYKDHDIVRIEPWIENAEVLSWDGRTGDNREQIRLLNQEIEALTGIRDIFGSEGDMGSSGTAIRMMDAKTQNKESRMLKDIDRAISESAEITVVSTHPYEVQAQTPVAQIGADGIERPTDGSL